MNCIGLPYCWGIGHECDPEPTPLQQINDYYNKEDS